MSLPKERRAMYDYIRAPERRFAPKLNHKRRQEVAALLDKQARKKLLRLVDTPRWHREK